MIEALDQLLRDNAVCLIFVVLGAGYLVGKTRVRGLELGSAAGVLFAGLIFGHYGYELPPSMQAFGFVMFIFSVGFQAGPSFFSVLRRDGLKYLVLSIVVAISGFGLSLSLSNWLDLPFGASAGLLGGGMTSTPTLAAAQDAIKSGLIALPAGTTVAEGVQNVATAYAITYVFGLIGLILIIRVVPGLLGINLAAEATKFGGVEVTPDPAEHVSIRAFRVEIDTAVGVPRREMRERVTGGATIVKLRRNGEFLDIDDDTVLEIGDEIAVVGKLGRFLDAPQLLGPELTDPDLLAMESESCQLVVTNRGAVGLTLGELGASESYACLLTKLVRMQVEVPIDPTVELERGDVLFVTGPSGNLDRLGERVGHTEREIEETDLLTLAFGIAVGIALGTLSVTVAGIPIGIGTAGGLLTTGLLIGYLRSIRPTFGRIPTAARWVFMELGLQMFMAGVGVSAGSGIVETLRSVGPSLVLGGVAVTIVPVVAGWVVGSYVLRLNPAVLLGAITGAMTSGAALSIVNDAAKSSVPALGYTGAYAFANIFLAIAGSLILRF